MEQIIPRERLRQWLHREYECVAEPTYDEEKLKDQGRVLLRPMVLHGHPSAGSIVLVAYNPATRITENEMHHRNITLRAYKEALLDAAEFEETIYLQVRGHEPGESHVRLSNLIQALRNEFQRSVIMTNCYAYPTKGESNMEQVLARAGLAEGVRATESSFAKEMSRHLPHVIRAAEPGAVIIAVGKQAQKMLAPHRTRGPILEHIRHPSTIPELRGQVPRYVPAWPDAVSQLLARLRDRFGAGLQY